MMHRWTLWEDEHGDPLQMSLAILDETWDVLMERTVPCGPFHDVEWARHELLDDARRWLRTYGIQGELAL